MGVQYLKYQNTRPILEVVLHDPAAAGSPLGTLGDVHDLTGSSEWYLHIWLTDGTKATRPMVVFGPEVNGTLRYTWVATDWDAGAGGPPFTTGGLLVGPDLPLGVGVREHRMEYEVVNGTARTSFPNGGPGTVDSYDILRIWQDIAQG